MIVSSLLTMDRLQRLCMPMYLISTGCNSSLAPDGQLPKLEIGICDLDLPNSEMVWIISINHFLRRLINSHIPPGKGRRGEKNPTGEAGRCPNSVAIPCYSPFLQLYCIFVFQFHERDLYISLHIIYIHRIHIYMNIKVEYTCTCWDKFLGPRWSCSWPGCHVSKRNIGNFPVSINVPHDHKHNISNQLISKHQVNSGFYAYFLFFLTLSEVDDVVTTNQILSIFFCFFFILYLIKVSCLPPIFQFSRPLGMEIACFMKC